MNLIPEFLASQSSKDIPFPLTLFLPDLVTWRSYMGWFRPWPVAIGLNTPFLYLLTQSCHQKIGELMTKLFTAYTASDSESELANFNFEDWQQQNSQCVYHKVVSINTSRLEAHFRFYRLFMKGKFDVYLLWPFQEKLIF